MDQEWLKKLKSGKAPRQPQPAIPARSSREEPSLLLLVPPRVGATTFPGRGQHSQSRCGREAETEGERKQTYEKAVLADLPGTLQSDRAAGGGAAPRSAVRGAGFATATRLPRAALGTARYLVHFQLKDPTHRTLPLKAIPRLWET